CRDGRIQSVPSRPGAPRQPHSFPTRRSSDLRSRAAWPRRCRPPMKPQPTRIRSRDSIKGLLTIGFPLALPLSLQIRKEDEDEDEDRKSTRLNSSHQIISYAVFCLKKKKQHTK